MQDFINQFKDSFSLRKEETNIGGIKFKNVYIARLFALLAAVLFVIGFIGWQSPGAWAHVIRMEVLQVSKWFALLSAFMMSRSVGMLLIITFAILSIVQLLDKIWTYGLLF